MRRVAVLRSRASWGKKKGNGTVPKLGGGIGGPAPRRCTRNGWWKWKLRYRGIVTEVGEDWHWNSSWEQAGIRRLTRGDLRGTSVIYNILHQGCKYACCGRVRIWIIVHNRVGHPTHKGCPNQLVANPFNWIARVLDIRIRLNDEVEIARTGASRRRSIL